MRGLSVGKKRCTNDQKSIEPASLVREHVTNTDGEIQMGGQVLILVATKYGKLVGCACNLAFVGSSDTCRQTANDVFKPIQQQPLHHTDNGRLLIHLYNF